MVVGRLSFQCVLHVRVHLIIYQLSLISSMVLLFMMFLCNSVRCVMIQLSLFARARQSFHLWSLCSLSLYFLATNDEFCG